jgi:hypothetical protein
MNELNLFPTKIYTDNIDREYCLLLFSWSLQHISYFEDEMDNSEIDNRTEQEIKENGNDYIFTDPILKNLFNKLNGNIKDIWLRTEHDHFELHCDSHHNTSHIAIVWINGENNKGGDILFYDPLWRNPRVLKEKEQSYTHTIKFQVGKIIIFPSNIWHRVTKYNGTEKRLVINIALDLKNGFNN